MSWYCIYSPLLHGKSAEHLIDEAFNLRNMKVRVWTPFQNIKRKRYNTEINDTIPLFPNYVFVEATFIPGKEQEMEQMLLELKAGHFLKYPGDLLPAVISQEEIDRIETLQAKEVQETHKEENYAPIEIGTYVEVATGSLMGLVKGIVVGSQKYTIEVETFFFGRSTSVKVPISALVRSTPTSSSLPLKVL